MAQPLSYNDGVLLVSLLYSCVDLHYEWDMFSECSRPIHKWLLVSYSCVIAFRLTHLLGMYASTSAGVDAASQSAGHANAPGDFLLDLRHKHALPRILSSLTWLVALPFFLLWTLLGTNWMYHVVRETPQCMPSSTHLWFSGLWLALCYIWIFIHAALGAVAWVLERRVRRAEGDLRAIADDDTISRWGQVSQISGYSSLSGAPAWSGLSPSEILALPSNVTEIKAQDMESEIGEGLECPICINELMPGDSIRYLPNCGHTFHRSCIDLWLLRRADCPLCKREVRRQGHAE